MYVKIEESWKKVLEEEFKKDYFKEITSKCRDAYIKDKIFPPPKYIFRAFDECKWCDLKVVILGQDPYHGLNQAHGLCFSVSKQTSIPPSLKNIFKELKSDIGKNIPDHGDLTYWASQGILLLNTVLTVKAFSPASHKHFGWEKFTNNVIKIISEYKSNIVFMLWGSYAQKKSVFIDTNKHLVLKSAHPSPFSADRGFFGNRHFSKTNEYLISNNKKPINW